MNNGMGSERGGPVLLRMRNLRSMETIKKWDDYYEIEAEIVWHQYAKLVFS